MIGHELYTGITGSAGEILEPLPDLGELIQTAEKKIGSNHPLLTDHPYPGRVSFRTIVDYAGRGCMLSSRVIDKICEIISEEIARLAGLLNPNLIVLGGDITCSPDLLAGRILPRTLKKAKKMTKMGFVLPEICFSSYGEFSVAIGATAMILRKVIRSQNYKTR